MADGTNTSTQGPTIAKEPEYETIKGNTESTSTLKEVGRSLENKVQRVSNRLFYGVNGVTLSSDRAKRWIQRKVGVSDGALQEKFANVYEWEAKNPKKTEAISQIQETQQGDRKAMEDTNRAPQERAVSSFSEMIKEIIINMLGGTTHREAVNYHNNKNKDYKIDEGSDLDNLIKKIFSNVKDDIKNGKFNVDSIDNNELSNAIKKHNSIAGKTPGDLTKQVNSTIKQRATEEHLAKKEGFKAVGDALQERKKKLEKYLKNTEINSLSDTTNNQKKTSAKKIAEYKKELAEINGKIAQNTENTENNLKDDQDRSAVLKGDITEAELDSKAKIVDALKDKLSKLEKRLGKMEINFKDQEGVLTKSGEVKFQNDIIGVKEQIEKLKGNITEAKSDLEATKKDMKLSDTAKNSGANPPATSESNAPKQKTPDTTNINNKQEPTNAKYDTGAQRESTFMNEKSTEPVKQPLTRRPQSAPATVEKPKTSVEPSTTRAQSVPVEPEKPKTRFQQSQQSIKAAKTKSLNTNKDIADSVKKQTDLNKKTIAKNKKTEKKITSPMRDSAFGSMIDVKSTKQSTGFIKTGTKATKLNANGSNVTNGAKTPAATSARVPQQTTKGHNGL